MFDKDDFDEEVRAHLEIAAHETIADGADEKSARLASLKEFGNVTLTTDAARRVWSPWWLDALHDQASDVRYAVRMLARNPVFSFRAARSSRRARATRPDSGCRRWSR